MDSRQWVESGKWKEVKSSNVKAISYVSQKRELFVQFKGRAKGVERPVYVYEDVPAHVAETFYNTDSFGEFVNRYLIPLYSADGPFNRR